VKKLQLVIVAALALALPGPSVAATAATIPITISATAFSPKTVTLNFADSIRWRNIDKVNHQLVADSGAFASPILKPGDSYTFTFKTAGKFGYHDALKPTLKGTVTVKGLPPAVTLGVGLPIVTYGQQTTLSGTVNNGQPNETILVNMQPYGSSVQQVATLTTGAGGSFSYTITPNIYTTYNVKWKTATSQTVTVQVRPKLTLTRSSKWRFYAKVTATPSFAGRSIYFQKHSQFGQWVTVSKLKLGPLSGRIFNVPHQKGTTYYRVYMTTNQAGLGYLETWSNAARVHFSK
jgi:plastocyanin